MSGVDEVRKAILRNETRQSLFEAHEDLCSAAIALMKKKNEDYATTDDPFRNFRYFGALGILVRLSDKLSRLRNYEERGKFSVDDESLRDTVQDAINYLVIYYAFKQEEGR